jgi:hypothetical protein
MPQRPSRQRLSSNAVASTNWSQAMICLAYRSMRISRGVYVASMSPEIMELQKAALILAIDSIYTFCIEMQSKAHRSSHFLSKVRVQMRWYIPAARMKMKTPHIVPLSRQAIEVLDLLRYCEWPNEREDGENRISLDV